MSTTQSHGAGKKIHTTITDTEKMPTAASDVDRDLSRTLERWSCSFPSRLRKNTKFGNRISLDKQWEIRSHRGLQKLDNNRKDSESAFFRSLLEGRKRPCIDKGTAKCANTPPNRHRAGMVVGLSISVNRKLHRGVSVPLW